MLRLNYDAQAFYDLRTSHRRLRWVHSLGSATVLGQFKPAGKVKEHDLMVSTYQVYDTTPTLHYTTPHYVCII